MQFRVIISEKFNDVLFIDIFLFSFVETCKIQPIMTEVIHNCKNDYNWFDDDTKDYLAGWLRPGSSHEQQNSDNGSNSNSTLAPNIQTTEIPVNDTVDHDITSPWVYQNSVELLNAPYPGLITMYKVCIAITSREESLDAKINISDVIWGFLLLCTMLFRIGDAA